MIWSVLLACGPQLTATPELVIPDEVVAPPSTLVGLSPDDGDLHLFDVGRTPGVNAGVELSANGLWAHAGMKGYTCDIWTGDGSVTADLNYPGGGDQVIDGDDDRLLIRTNEGLYATRFGYHTPSGELHEEFLADALLVDGGLATLAWEEEGCRVAWYSQVDAPDTRTFLDEPWCGAGVTMLADRASGTIWLVDDTELARVTPDGIETVELGGDLLAWDPVWHQTYVATAGESGVQVVDETGHWRTFETAGPVHALGGLGQVGALIVGSPGVLEVLWGDDGQVWGAYEGLLQAEGKLKASETGAMLGAVDGTSARFFLGEVY